jgi:hypothetical protein
LGRAATGPSRRSSPTGTVSRSRLLPPTRTTPGPTRRRPIGAASGLTFRLAAAEAAPRARYWLHPGGAGIPAPAAGWSSRAPAVGRPGGRTSLAPIGPARPVPIRNRRPRAVGRGRGLRSPRGSRAGPGERRVLRRASSLRVGRPPALPRTPTVRIGRRPARSRPLSVCAGRLPARKRSSRGGADRLRTRGRTSRAVTGRPLTLDRTSRASGGCARAGPGGATSHRRGAIPLDRGPASPHRGATVPRRGATPLHRGPTSPRRGASSFSRGPTSPRRSAASLDRRAGRFGRGPGSAGGGHGCSWRSSRSTPSGR